MTRAALLGLAALHAIYVALQLPSVATPIALALWLGLVATHTLDPPRAAAWASCHALVLALLHLRMLSPAAPLAPVQVGLAAAIVASAILSLAPAPRAPHLATVVALGSALGAAAALLGPGSTLVGVLGGALAGLRPLGALEAIVDRPRDPWLAWSPLAGGHR